MSNRWAAKVAGRVAANAVVGGLLVGIVGALCLGAAGYGLGLSMDYFFSLSGIKPNVDNLATTYFSTSVVEGFFFSGLLGAIIFGIAAFKAPPGRFFAPLSALIGRVALGQLLGVVATLTFFAAWEAAKMRLQNQSWIDGVDDDFELIMFGVPALMICGAIAGALSKRPARQSATLKAE